MELTRVLLKDVYPDENNPRQEFAGIEEMAESFKLNSERPGEPFIPPIVVRDGGVFRIVDGERRYRAMKSLGVIEFEANVCEDFDEADAMVAMLATDDKAQLTDIEKSRGVQRMLLLGVDPEKVGRAARIGECNARKAAVAIKVAGERADQMTLDRCYALAGFADDPEAVDAILSASEGEWRYTAHRFREKRKAEAREAELRARVRELALSDEIAWYADRSCADEDGFGYVAYVSAADTLDQVLGKWAGREIACAASGNGFSIFVKGEGELKPDPEAERIDRLRAELRELHDGFLEAARTWFTSALMAGDIGKASALAASCREHFEDGCYADVGGVYEHIPDLRGDGISRIDYVLGYWNMEPELFGYTILSICKGEEGAERRVLEFLDFMDLMSDGGMPEDEGSARLRSLLEGYRDREPDGAGDGEDE